MPFRFRPWTSVHYSSFPNQTSHQGRGWPGESPAPSQSQTRRHLVWLSDQSSSSRPDPYHHTEAATTHLMWSPALHTHPIRPPCRGPAFHPFCMQCKQIQAPGPGPAPARILWQPPQEKEVSYSIPGLHSPGSTLSLFTLCTNQTKRQIAGHTRSACSLSRI